MEQPLITARGVYKSYGSLKAVNDVSFQIHRSTCFGFLGPNGAGKTTMMKILYGLATRDNPDESTVNVLGFDPAHDALSIKAQAGVVPQEDNLDVELSVRQNLRLYAGFYNMGRNEAGRRIDELLAFMELSDRSGSKIRELSGGMKRRLLIARALIAGPKLLILDEPTTGLDPQVRHAIWDRIRMLKRKGVTVILTTHYMDEAYQLADTVLIMDKGNTILQGRPNELVDDHIEAYVLEIVSNSAPVNEIESMFGQAVRKEESSERILYYSNNIDLLNGAAGRMDGSEYIVRQSNLEDVFLKATGRGLNEQQ